MTCRLMYISDYMYTVGGSHENSVMHLRCLQHVLGEDNVVCVALTAGKSIDADDGYIHLQGYRNKAGQLMNLLLLNDYCLNSSLNNRICNEISTRKIDIVFMNCTMGKLARAIKRKFPDICIISFYHDIKAQLLKEWVKEKGVKAIPLSNSGRYNEKQMQKHADLHATLNQRDARAYKEIYGRNSDYCLPIVLEDKFTSGEMINHYPMMQILFAGVYYYPNVQGIQWFCSKVLPLVEKPIHLNIVGLNMEKLRGEINDPRVTVVGTVDDISKWYSKSDLVIAPIFKGGGMKIKTAEAFMYGKMYIGTDESMEGYSEIIPHDLKDKYIFQCNTDEEFANAINEAYDALSKQHEGYNKVIRKLFVDNFSLEAGVKRMSELVNIAMK